MSIPQRALELENRYRSLEADGEATLFAAYQVLRDHWRSGHCDRETALHLAFLAWFMLVEPARQTGYEQTEDNDTELVSLFNEAHDWLDPAQSEDAELLYVFGLMADLAGYLVMTEWERCSREYHVEYRQLRPDGLDPKIFHDRGAFGDYFAMQAAVKDGY